LWDILTIALLAGLGAISITTLLPAFRRLKRHAVHGWKWALPRKLPRVGIPVGAATSTSQSVNK
jgi:hypothetical protein